MAYPASLDELTDGVPSDGAAASTPLGDATYPMDDWARAVSAAVEAVQATLATDPQGSAASVKARIAATETVANAALPAATAASTYQPLDADLTAVAALTSPATTITGAVQKSLVDAAGDLLVGTAADTVGRLAMGSASQVLRVNSGATGLEWAAPSGGSGLSLIGTAAEWFGVAPGMIRLAFAEPVLTPGANKTIYMGPYHVTGALTLGGGVFKVQAVTGTANVRFAIISMNTSTWQPSAVVKDFGELTYTSTGEKVVTFSNVTIDAGWYFVGVRTDSASLAFSGMRMAPVSGWRGQQDGYLTFTHLTKSETYGAWASTPTAWDTVVAGSTTGLWGATHVLDWRLGA